MELTEEDFEKIRELQNKFNKTLINAFEVHAFELNYEEADFIAEALTQMLEKEIDNRRKKDKVKSRIEDIFIPIESKCRHELPCGICDINQKLCSFKYSDVSDYGNGI